jgi:hypothetical protein
MRSCAPDQQNQGLTASLVSFLERWKIQDVFRRIANFRIVDRVPVNDSLTGRPGLPGFPDRLPGVTFFLSGDQVPFDDSRTGLNPYLVVSIFNHFSFSSLRSARSRKKFDQVKFINY